MASGGDGHTHKEQMSRGVALVSTLMLSVLILLALGGLYLLLTRLFESGQTIRTYAGVKQAAAGGVEIAILRIRNEEIRLPDDCTNGFTLPFRLVQAGDQTFDNRVSVCYVGQTPGYGLGGVAYTGLSGQTRAGHIYRIISEATGPQGSFHRIEALYVR